MTTASTREIGLLFGLMRQLRDSRRPDFCLSRSDSVPGHVGVRIAVFCNSSLNGAVGVRPLRADWVKMIFWGNGLPAAHLQRAEPNRR